MTKFYNDPTFNTTREMFTIAALVGTDTTVFFRTSPVKHGMKVRRVLWEITVAGTNDVAGFDVMSGTTSVGALTIGTESATVVMTSSDMKAAIAASSYLALKGKATSATMAGYVTIEYETPFSESAVTD